MSPLSKAFKSYVGKSIGEFKNEGGVFAFKTYCLC
ncbi:hypothetical protein QO182_09745 [Flavobacterium sp. Arc2]